MIALAVLPALALLGCERKTAKAVPPRPVRVVTAATGGTGETVVLTGQISAENEASLSFRIGGRIIERFVNVGDRVEPDQVLAKLDPQNELNALRSAQAAVSAAEGRLVETSNAYNRQKTLLPQGFTTQALYDQAQQAMRTAQSQLDNAEAQLHIAKDRVSYTELKAGVAGSITARAAEAGEVVQPGQTVFQVARQDGRDAVFDVPAQVIRSAPPDPKVTVSLTDDPSVTAMGRVRQVDPQADPILPPRTLALKPGTRGEFDALSNARCRKNRVTPIASRLIATPHTTWSALNRMVATAWIIPNSSPPATAHSTPIQGLPLYQLPSAAAKAPVSMKPSSVSEMIPDRSATMPPAAANR